MERIEKEFPQYQIQLFRLLTIQYRMNKVIMEWSSQRFYNNRLEAHHSVTQHKLWYTVMGNTVYLVAVLYLEVLPYMEAVLARFHHI